MIFILKIGTYVCNRQLVACVTFSLSYPLPQNFSRESFPRAREELGIFCGAGGISEIDLGNGGAGITSHSTAPRPTSCLTPFESIFEIERTSDLILVKTNKLANKQSNIILVEQILKYICNYNVRYNGLLRRKDLQAVRPRDAPVSEESAHARARV